MTNFPVEFFLGVLRFIVGTPLTDVQKVVILPLVGLAMLLQVVVILLLLRLRRYELR